MKKEPAAISPTSKPANTFKALTRRILFKWLTSATRYREQPTSLDL